MTTFVKQQKILDARKLRHETGPIPDPNDENYVFTQEEVELHEIMRKKEKRALRDFDISLLSDMGCWGLENALPNDLSCPIHPVYRKLRWVDKQAKDVKIGDGVLGDWSIDNPVVWDTLVPCLRLATMMLTNMKLFPYIEALMFSKWEVIEGDQLYKATPAQQKYGVHWIRLNNDSGPLSEERWERCLRNLATYRTKWEFALAPTLSNKWRGYTMATRPGYCSKDEPNLESFILLYLVEPLINGGLVESEKLAQQFSVAKTHAVTRSVMFFNPDFKRLTPDYPNEFDGEDPEPFTSAALSQWLTDVALQIFENEEVGEAGWTWENQFFGGVLEPLFTIDDSEFQRAADQKIFSLNYPFLGAVCRTFPSYAYYHGLKANIAKLKTNKYDDGAKLYEYPISSVYFENLGQEQFWNACVRSLGRLALNIPKIYGLEAERRNGGSYHLGYVRGPDFQRELGEIDPGSYELPPPPLPGTYVEQWQLRESRLRQMSVIKIALRGQRKFRKGAGEDQVNLEKAISAFRAKRFTEADECLYNVKKIGFPSLKLPCLLLYSLLPESYEAPGAQKSVKALFERANALFEQGNSKYKPTIMEKIYSEIGEILTICGAMSQEDQKAVDFRARVKRRMRRLKFPTLRTKPEESESGNEGYDEGGDKSSQNPPERSLPQEPKEEGIGEMEGSRGGVGETKSRQGTGKQRSSATPGRTQKPPRRSQNPSKMTDPTSDIPKIKRPGVSSSEKTGESSSKRGGESSEKVGGKKRNKCDQMVKTVEGLPLALTVGKRPKKPPGET
ncbi:hypothetical protein HYFRA_00003096 [Hymenoscyphus fraxineus]|uniref:Uncharacterized protein n=1 Tax=Hymenoscyphus fraxineus TaxID=746836 RepID=A0A9N9KN85_9HELO|nr:hypothetical protein HYFRA_00003096 [Hymenoscyphus fraxineus]